MLIPQIARGGVNYIYCLSRMGIAAAKVKLFCRKRTGHGLSSVGDRVRGPRGGRLREVCVCGGDTLNKGHEFCTDLTRQSQG